MSKKLRKSKIKKMSLLALLHQKVDVDALLESIFLNEDKLYESALAQPVLMALAGRLRVQRMHIRVKLETRLDLEKARVGLRFRRIKDAGGRKAFTEGAVKERIELDPVVRRLQKRLNRALSLEEMTKNLLEVFRTRSDSLRTIVSAGKVSLHARELEILAHNKKGVTIVNNLREAWRNNKME